MKRHVSEILLPSEAPQIPPPSRSEFENVQTQPMFQGNVRDAVEAMIKVALRVQDTHAEVRKQVAFGSTVELDALNAAVHSLTGVRLFLERCIGPKTHNLKTWPGPFRQVKMGLKKYEVRKADRDFAVGDVLILQEWDNDALTYTGDSLRARVVAMTSPGNFGLPIDTCVLGIEVEL